MDYLENLYDIQKQLLILDGMSCETIKEANNCLIEYDQLKDEIILIIREAMTNTMTSIATKENIYNEAILILSNYIGSADDIQKYESLLESLLEEGKITKQQLKCFRDNLDIGRWR